MRFGRETRSRRIAGRPIVIVVVEVLLAGRRAWGWVCGGDLEAHWCFGRGPEQAMPRESYGRRDRLLRGHL